MKRILAYAFGPSFDHVVRVAAVLRRLMRVRGVEGHVISNQTLPFEDDASGIHWYACPAEAYSAAAKTRELIDRLGPVLFLVDAYPRGYRNELPDVLDSVPCARALLQQYLDPRRQADGNLSDFVAENYHVSIAPRDGCGYQELGRAMTVEPLTYYSTAEMLEEVDAKVALNYSGRPILLFYDTAPEGSQFFETLRKECRTVAGLRVDWRIHTNNPLVAERYPERHLSGLSLSRLGHAIHGAVSPAGYTYYHEAAMTGVPTLFMTRADPKDPERLRAGPLAITDPNTLVQMIRDGRLPERTVPVSYNGAETAAGFLRQIMGFGPAPPRRLRAAV